MYSDVTILVAGSVELTRSVGGILGVGRDDVGGSRIDDNKVRSSSRGITDSSSLAFESIDISSSSLSRYAYMLALSIIVVGCSGGIASVKETEKSVLDRSSMGELSELLARGVSVGVPDGTVYGAVVGGTDGSVGGCSG